MTGTERNFTSPYFSSYTEYVQDFSFMFLSLFVFLVLSLMVIEKNCFICFPDSQLHSHETPDV